MTRRPGRWELVGHDSDPVPADTFDVRVVAARLGQRALDVGEAADVLEQLSRLEGWTGDAAEVFAESAADRVGDLRKVEDRYERASDALFTYAGDVSTARSDTDAALTRAVEAESARAANDRDTLDGVDEPTDAQRDAQDRMDEAAGDALTALAGARGDVADALARLDSAASRCAEEIEDAADSFKDGWFDDFQGWVRDNAGIIDIIITVLEIIAVVVAVALLVCAFIIAAPAMLVTALVVAGIAAAVGILALRTMMASAGEATWGEVAWDLAGLALTLVGGRLATNALRGVSRGLTSASAAITSSMQATAREGLPLLARMSLRFANGPLSILARHGTRLATASDDAVAATVRTASETQATTAQIARSLDRGLANQIAQIEALRNLGVASVTPALDEAARLAALARGINVANTVVALDQAIGIGLPTPSDLIEMGVDEGLEEISQLHWRLTQTR